jgi:hypothetical protein
LSTSSRFEPVAATLFALALYAATGARDVQWGDPAKLTLYVFNFQPYLDQGTHLGALAWAWPFTRLPIGSFAFRMTLASAAASALATGFLHASLLKCVRSPWAARTGTASFVVSHTFWFVSAIPESYPVSLLALTSASWLIVNGRNTLAAGLVLGVGALSNTLTLFGIPAALWWLWQGRGGSDRDVLRVIIGVIAGLGIPILLVVPFNTAPMAMGTEWLGVLRSYTNWRTPATNLPLLAAYFAYNFAGPALVLIAVGFKSLGRRERMALAILGATDYLFGLFYLPQRSYLIPLPVYLAAASLVAVGSDQLLHRNPRISWVLFTSVVIAPVAIYGAVPLVLTGIRLPGVVRQVPFRDEIRFYLRPWKNDERSARRYIEALDRVIPNSAAVVGDFTIVMPLLYANRVEGWKAECAWEIVDLQPSDDILRAIGTHLAHGRRVFLLDDKPYYYPDEIRRRWDVAPAGVGSLQEVTLR